MLFGARAYGNPTEESDVDLPVLMRTRRPVHAAAEMVGEARLVVPLDVVMNPEAFEKALKEGYLFETKIARQEIVLYEKAESSRRKAL
jgi:predicted nucleotidyltransferase